MWQIRPVGDAEARLGTAGGSLRPVGRRLRRLGFGARLALTLSVLPGLPGLLCLVRFRRRRGGLLRRSRQLGAVGSDLLFAARGAYETLPCRGVQGVATVLDLLVDATVCLDVLCGAGEWSRGGGRCAGPGGRGVLFAGRGCGRPARAVAGAGLGSVVLPAVHHADGSEGDAAQQRARHESECAAARPALRPGPRAPVVPASGAQGPVDRRACASERGKGGLLGGNRDEHPSKRRRTVERRGSPPRGRATPRPHERT